MDHDTKRSGFERGGRRWQRALRGCLLGGAATIFGAIGCSVDAGDRDPASSTIGGATAQRSSPGSSHLLVAAFVGRWDGAAHQLTIVPARAGGTTATEGWSTPADDFGLTTLGAGFNDGTTTTYDPSGTQPACTTDGFEGAVCASIAVTNATGATLTGVDVEIIGLTTGVVVFGDDSASLTGNERAVGIQTSPLGVWRGANAAGWSSTLSDGASVTLNQWNFGMADVSVSLDFGIKVWGLTAGSAKGAACTFDADCAASDCYCAISGSSSPGHCVGATGTCASGMNVFATANTTSTPQTWARPTGCASVFIEAWGAGGGGSGYLASTSGGAGGGGAYATSTYAFTGADTFKVVVGGGGAGGDGATSTGGAGGAGWRVGNMTARPGGTGGSKAGAIAGGGGGGLTSLDDTQSTSLGLVSIGAGSGGDQTAPGQGGQATGSGNGATGTAGSNTNAAKGGGGGAGGAGGAATTGGGTFSNGAGVLTATASTGTAVGGGATTNDYAYLCTGAGVGGAAGTSANPTGASGGDACVVIRCTD